MQDLLTEPTMAENGSENSALSVSCKGSSRRWRQGLCLVLGYISTPRKSVYVCAAIWILR